MNLRPATRDSGEAKRDARGWEESGSGRWYIFAVGLNVFREGHNVVSSGVVSRAMGGAAIVVMD